MRPDDTSEPDRLEAVPSRAHLRTSDGMPRPQPGRPIPRELPRPSDPADDDDLARYVELC